MSLSLSPFTRDLWAKKECYDGVITRFLYEHLLDVARVAGLLYDGWVSDGVREQLNRNISTTPNKDARNFLLFLAMMHDIGKATAHFQNGSQGHTLEAFAILRYLGCSTQVASIAGAHHGVPQDSEKGSQPPEALIFIQGKRYFGGRSKEDKEPWLLAWQELLAFALEVSGYSNVEELPTIDTPCQVLLCGVLIMADWIASGEPNIQSLDFPENWIPERSWVGTDFYQKRFGFSANTMQTEALSAIIETKQPGIVVLEAPMGTGKTEAALAMAEVLAYRLNRKGLYFALPTQATSDGLFHRVSQWMSILDAFEEHSLQLMHGKALFNQEYQNLVVGDSDVDGLTVHQWFSGRKRRILDEFGVGTIDQLLLAALKQKHFMLRHLGLANKVVVIDECHAYDAYMSSYLEMVLKWLGTYRVPVIVLSATLPAEKRISVVRAYIQGRSGEYPSSDDTWKTSTGYPLITYSEDNCIKQKAIEHTDTKSSIAIKRTEDIVATLEDLLSNGGCAGVVLNTVAGAQEATRELSEVFGSDTVRLLHSRFTTSDRAMRERELLDELSKKGARPDKRIVVGTQVIEQSLDIDFDVLITELAPMDLLIQRMGRLHRHSGRNRPNKLKQPVCLVVNPSKGAEYVYGKYLLAKTDALLPDSITVPVDIPLLVQAVYGEENEPLNDSEEYALAWDKHKQAQRGKEKRADDFRIKAPKRMVKPQNTLVGMLDCKIKDDSEKQGEAAVRDSDESVEVAVLWKTGNRMCSLPWLPDSFDLDPSTIPPDSDAQLIAGSTLRLPAILCAPWNISQTIHELEQVCSEMVPEWQKSSWLKGQLFLVLDEHYSTTLNGTILRYSQQFGLEVEKEYE